jgi:centrin-3
MASSSQPHAFPSRPYTSSLHPKLPERTAATAFGASHASREAARIERDRAARESQAQAGPSSGVNSLTDEQREEINEAVRPAPLPRTKARC